MKIITQEELNTILEKHKIWLEDNSKGKRADLSFTDLSGANLSYVNLSYANLYKADLSYANLYIADLSNANLTGVDLFGVDLFGTDLSNTDLTNLASFNFLLDNTKTDKTYFQIPNIGSRKGITTYCLDDDWIFCGCWNDCKGGSLEEFEKRIENIYRKKEEEPNKKYYDEYKRAINYFKECKSGL